MLTRLNKFEGLSFRWNLTKLSVATQDDNICSILLSRISWAAKVHFFITTNFQNIVMGAQGDPFGSMITHTVPFPTNYSLIVSKHSTSYQAVCNHVPNTFDSTTCRPAVRLRRWLLNWYLITQRQRGSPVVCPFLTQSSSIISGTYVYSTFFGLQLQIIMLNKKYKKMIPKVIAQDFEIPVFKCLLLREGLKKTPLNL